MTTDTISPQCDNTFQLWQVMLQAPVGLDGALENGMLGNSNTDCRGRLPFAFLIRGP
jgi:hypothetical protein